MEDSKTLDISLEDIKILPEINPILKNLPKLRRQSNNFTCNLADTTVDSDNSENLQSCGSVCVYNLQQQLIFNCEFCDLKYGDLDNFKRHLHEAHNLFQLEEEPVKENAGKKRQSSKVCTAVKKEPLEPPIDLPSTYFTEPLVSCGAVFIFNQQKFHLACGYCDCSKYDNLDMFEKHVKQQHNILEGAHNELNVVPKVEVKEEVFLITEVVEPTEVKVEKEEPLEEGVLDIKQSYSDDEEEEDEDENEEGEDDEENEIDEDDEDDEEFIDEDDEDDEDEEGEENETEDEQNTSKATKRKTQGSPSDEPSTSSSAKTKTKSKNDKVECGICHKRIRKGNLSTHKKRHLRKKLHLGDVKKRFQCDQCDETFSELVSDYFATHAGEKPYGKLYKCQFCVEKFKLKSELHAPKRIHAEENGFECDVCHERFPNKRFLNNHESSECKVGGRFNCEHCSKKFKRRLFLDNHLRTHTGEQPYECEICHKRFRDQGNFSVHKKRHLGDAGKNFKCDKCDKTYFTSGDLRNHIILHHAKEESKKAQPLELKADNRVFNCEHCNKNFKRRSTLTIHLRIHTGEKPYECEICQQRFRNLGYYNIHKRRHQGDAGKTAKCEYCDKTYFTTGELRNHIMEHHAKENSKKTQPLELKADNQVFNCEHCNKNFKRRSTLAEHLRIHTGEKPYECDICQNRFRTLGNCNIHKRRHQGDAGKTKECDYCDKKFMTNVELWRHINYVHKEEFKTS